LLCGVDADRPDEPLQNDLRVPLQVDHRLVGGPRIGRFEDDRRGGLCPVAGCGRERLELAGGRDLAENGSGTTIPDPAANVSSSREIRFRPSSFTTSESVL